MLVVEHRLLSLNGWQGLRQQQAHRMWNDVFLHKPATFPYSRLVELQIILTENLSVFFKFVFAGGPFQYRGCTFPVVTANSIRLQGKW